MKRKRKYGKTSIDPALVIKDAGYTNHLEEVQTSKKKRQEMKQEIRKDLQHWMENKAFDNMRDELLDIAIVFYLNESRMNRQDVDNLAKVVLDGLQKDKTNPDLPYLFTDDSQVIRLLLYKIRKTDDERYDTDQLYVSIRKHNPKKQMLLYKDEKW